MNQDTRPGPKPPRIAYIIKCFPRLSETFILHEVLELERQGLPLSIFSLLKPEGQINEAARDVQSPVTYIPRGFPGGAMRLLAAALKRAVKSPRRFLRTIIASLMRYHHPATPRHLFLAAYLANELEQQIRELDLGDRVTLQGAMTHERVITMYAQAAMQALPCIISENGDRDGIPNVLVEAMYMGVPVISTPVSGIPELIRHELNGLLVPDCDEAALADAMSRLLDDTTLCRRLAVAGRRTVLAHFDMANNATGLLQLLLQGQMNEPPTGARERPEILSKTL